MSRESAHGRTLSVRLPHRLADELQQRADRESNSPSAVARRLISAGLLREARSDGDALRDEEAVAQ